MNSLVHLFMLEVREITQGRLRCSISAYHMNQTSTTFSGKFVQVQLTLSHACSLPNGNFHRKKCALPVFWPSGRRRGSLKASATAGNRRRRAVFADNRRTTRRVWRNIDKHRRSDVGPVDTLPRPRASSPGQIQQTNIHFAFS